MTIEKLVIVNLINGIDSFQKSVYKNTYNKKNTSQYHISYCSKEDTIHQHLGRDCIDCNILKAPYISFSTSDFKKLKLFFKSSFHEKFCDILDDWPQKNKFPNKINSERYKLQEHKKLITLYEIWDSLKQDKKYSQLDELILLQKELENTLKNLEELKLKF